LTRLEEYESLLERSRRFCETASMQVERLRRVVEEVVRVVGGVIG
jgi:hypothetical protein